ncbi:MAG: TIGR00341 family protein [Cyclobacteriaceae bacterium]|nr:TIGR00341 family protein [Cyclobacteriaceae bacterium]MBX2955579.1 TIGR00341 family protein [Cyclobacteriaceae bacterium]
MSSEKRLYVVFLQFIRDRFNLESDKADELETLEYIRKGVEFKGANLWILIFAIFIASIGLNVNSTAVIIGAMLISPLMGPILGIGTGVAINDLDLLNKSFKNLMIATLFSVVTSTLYFAISPLSTAQSELLARTNPTIWDVMIAFFGGLAGIVAGSRKEKSNAIPGVAIATALMPPLCTAGYGLASGNMYYFFGAFYLFFINSVFISLATFLIVRFLKYPKKEFADEARERKVKTWITFFVIVTIIPSTYLAYKTVKHSIFERNAYRFIAQELDFENARVISRELHSDTDGQRIEVSLFGEPVSEELIENAKKQLSTYGLDGTELFVLQGYTEGINEASLASTIRSGVIEELYKQNEQSLRTKDEKIKLLESELTRIERVSNLTSEVSQELKALYPSLSDFSINQSLVMRMDSLQQDTVYLAYLKFKRKPASFEVKKLDAWLRARVKSDNIEMIIH